MVRAAGAPASGFPPIGMESAIAHATANVPVAEPDEAAGVVRERLLGVAYDTVADVAVCVERRLVGLVPIERLLAVSAETEVGEVMDREPPTIAPGVDQEVAAWTMVRHHEDSLAVVDDDGLLIGVIPPARMLAVLLQEHEEDLARFSGVLATSREARTASGERVGRRLLHRLPWLALGLAGAMISTWLVGSSEEQLTRTVELAFFMPAIVYMADAVGTQTETLAVRGLSVGVPIRRVIGKELLTGTLIGVLIAALFAPFSLLLFDDRAVALTVSLALLASCSLATAVAMGLPWLLNVLGRDPAFGSGPLATVLQDLLSLVIYLTLAGVIVG